MKTVASLVALVLFGPLLASLGAPDRELNWPLIAVEAHLDAEGVLRVREVQRIRFVGDWNGAERRFDVGLGQSFTFRRLARVDAVTGREVELTRGDLSRVDRWDYADGPTSIRWRSRLPTDPPFRGQEITYVLEAEYGSILRPRPDGTYLLDHDFSFAMRYGTIDEFTVRLTLDPAWQAPAGFTGEFSGRDLPPGRGFVVTTPLTYLRAELPAAVFRGAGRLTKQAVTAAVMLTVLAFFLRLFERERALGRFAGSVSADDVDSKFLDEHVLKHDPEVIGGAWDNRTSAPEVAAMLARMVQEGKLSSRVTKKRGFGRREVLHLKLEVPRERLRAHELKLVAALFSGSKTTTDTEAVRERYSHSGFDPSSIISPDVTRAVAGLAPKSREGAPSRRRTVGLLIAAVVFLVGGIISHPADIAVAASFIASATPLYLFALIWAAGWRGRVTGLYVRAMGFVLPLVILMTLLVGGVLLSEVRATALTFIGLGLWTLMLTSNVTNIARSRESEKRIAVRKRLAAARAFFKRELRKERPTLSDAWYPYLIAFGLGSHMDRWFRAFGAAGGDAMSMRDSSGGGFASRSGGGGTGASSWSGFGGGGGFAGGGAGGSFTAAVSGMAASVPSPSSSDSGGSSGGGGGGGGSSGGGGGGGW